MVCETGRSCGGQIIEVPKSSSPCGDGIVLLTVGRTHLVLPHGLQGISAGSTASTPGTSTSQK